MALLVKRLRMAEKRLLDAFSNSWSGEKVIVVQMKGKKKNLYHFW
jgi:hypothetical protein